MEFFSAYILSVVGIILLGVIVDLMLIDGQVKKYVKSIYVLFVIFTLVAPLPKLVSNLKSGDFTLPTSDIQIEQSYLEIILNQKNIALANAIRQAFLDEGYDGVNIEIEATYENDYVVKKIVVNVKNLQYRIKEEKIIKIVQSVIKIDKECISIDE